MTSGPVLPAPTWFVGCGNMGQSIIGGWRSAGIDLSQAVVIDPSGLSIEGVRTVGSFPDAGIPPKLVVLGFKPQSLEEVAPQLKPWITSRTTVLSILVGVEPEASSSAFRAPARSSGPCPTCRSRSAAESPRCTATMPTMR
jgi:pyrroline-5-carboxylate reductase